MNKLFLKLVMLPRGLWQRAGADTGQLEAILNLRLMIDDRRPMTMGRRKEQKKERKNGSVASFFIFGFMGIMYMLPLGLITDRVTSMVVLYTIMLFMLVLTLITDFSNVLFDNKDKFILFPRPINDATLVLAKLLHIFIYLLRMVLPMSLGSWILLGVMDGWKAALLFPLPMLLLVGLALFLVNGTYLLLLKVVAPAKFKDVINYFQVATSVIYFVVIYFVILPMSHKEVSPVTPADLLQYKWLVFLPTTWLASCWVWIGNPGVWGTELWMSVAGVIVPLVSVVALVRWLAPSFSARISSIDGAEVTETTAVKAARKGGAGKLYLKLANLFNRHSAARAGFIIAWLQSSRSRTFRMRVYPSFAFIPIYFIYLLTQNGKGITHVMDHLSERPVFLLLLYMSAYALINALNYLIISDHYKAAWVYYSTPVDVPGMVMIGALKAMWVKFFLPFFLAISAFVVWIWGVRVLPDIALALCNVTLLALCLARIIFRQLPFSAMEQAKQKGGKVVRSLLVMIVPFVLGGGHYLALQLWWLKLVFMALSGIMLWLLWDSYAQTTWANIAREDEQ